MRRSYKERYLPAGTVNYLQLPYQPPRRSNLPLNFYNWLFTVFTSMRDLSLQPCSSPKCHSIQLLNQKLKMTRSFVLTLKPRAIGVEINCNIRGHGAAKAAELEFLNSIFCRDYWAYTGVFSDSSFV
jgi:hypothetical protein